MTQLKYVFVLQYGIIDDVLYKDLIELPDVEVFYVGKPMANNLAAQLRRIHTSVRATKYFEPPFKEIWYLSDLVNVLDEDTTVVFQIGSMINFGLKSIELLKKRSPKVRLALMLIDSLNAHSKTVPYAKRYINEPIWDNVLSFDLDDCRKFGFTYLGLHYYSMLDDLIPSENACDLYYAGRIKNEGERKRLLETVCTRASESSVKCNFLLTGISQDKTVPGINTRRDNLPYRTILEDVLAARCILELIQPGQNTQTVRYMEAVCYNKKLLTNNPNIASLPYYDSDCMRFFSSADDIDYDWIKENVPIDYKYNGLDFSPKAILDLL